jgi:tryptophan-rich sensory protein
MHLIQKKSPVPTLFLFIFLCEGIGFASGYMASAINNDWFDKLIKPSWNPPAYLFGPVWTILYLLMGISLWLVWKNKSAELYKGNVYLLFSIQLFLNFMWSIIFFKLESPSFAFFDIVLLLISIGLTMKSFSYYSKLAAWLLLPYISWVSFATILNYTIWDLNK